MLLRNRRNRRNTQKRKASRHRRSRRYRGSRRKGLVFSARRRRTLKGGGVDPSFTGSYVMPGAVVDYYEQEDDIPGPREFRFKEEAVQEKLSEDL